MVEDIGGDSPVLGVDQQHGLQQRHKLSPVCFLCLHVAVIRTQHQVHLTDKKTLHENHRAAVGLCRNLLGNTEEFN